MAPVSAGVSALIKVFMSSTSQNNFCFIVKKAAERISSQGGKAKRLPPHFYQNYPRIIHPI
jgi:hypothetical protein